MAEIIGSTIIDDTKGILDEMKIFEATRKATKHRKKKKNSAGRKSDSQMIRMR